MSIDYDASFGLGIYITDDMVKTLIEKGFFSEEEYEEDEYGCLASLKGLYLVETGSYYYGETSFYATVPTDNYLEQINGAVDKFIVNIEKYFGIKLEYKDLNIVGGVLVS